MAEWPELRVRSPRWLNALIWSTGLGAAVCFIWQSLFCDIEPSCMPVGPATLASRLLAGAMLPAALAATLIRRAAKRAAG